MNLHSIVRGAITSVNPDITAQYRASTGPTSNADFSRTPSFAAAVPVRVQVQPLSRAGLRLVEKQNLQGVFRTVFLYGNPQGIVRVLAQGGDLLQFPPFRGQVSQTWKVVDVNGPWNVENGGWTELVVCLQTDTPS
jgi:hypothetical protein